MATDITHIRGDSRTITATFYESDGTTAINLTNGSVFLTVGDNQNPPDDTDALITKEVTSFDAPATGEVAITLEPSDTKDLEPGTYYYDIQFVSSAGDVVSMPRARFIVRSDITRRVA